MRISSSRNSEQSRRAILEAARHAFGQLGVDGARTEAIARAAGVNKAMLYYYFSDKEALYGAVLDDVFSTRFRVLGAILGSEASPGEKLLRFASRHYDYVSGKDYYPRLVQYEVMRATAGQSRHLPRLVETFFRPMLERVGDTVRRGIDDGELRAVDPLHLVWSMIGVNIFHALSAPVLKHLLATDPQGGERLAGRRAATLDFLAASIFRDRERGIRLAAAILAEPAEDLPQPATGDDQQ